MTTSAIDFDGVRTQAAALAFALVRFDEPAAHPIGGWTPPGMPRVGTDAYVFSPVWTPVPREAVVPFLAGLPSPAIIVQSTTRGILGLTLLDELTGDRRRWAQKTFDNHKAGLAELAKQGNLTDSSLVLFEFGDESHIFSLAAIREWSERFALNVGWNIGALPDDARASARLNARRSDGRWSSGVGRRPPPTPPESP
jgi:hypothetical protein